MKSLTNILNEHKKSNCERLGQFFVNRYIDNAWPELFCEMNHIKAMLLIKNWLTENSYIENNPPYSEQWRKQDN